MTKFIGYNCINCGMLTEEEQVRETMDPNYDTGYACLECDEEAFPEFSEGSKGLALRSNQQIRNTLRGYTNLTRLLIAIIAKLDELEANKKTNGDHD